MSLNLGADQVTLYSPPAGADAHGWALAPTAAVWAGLGSLQPVPGRSDDAAGPGGGHGPHDPARSRLALLYLPPAANPADGMVAHIGGEQYALSQCRIVTDPRGTGELDCWTATATGTSTYPAGGG
jgi:hypothetical protein